MSLGYFGHADNVRPDLPLRDQGPWLCPKKFPLASLRYDLSKLRAKGVIAKLPRSRRSPADRWQGCIEVMLEANWGLKVD
jgi:hypothetical protein